MKTDSPFYYSNFFEDTGIFTDIFSQQEYCWQTISQIKEFIDNFKNSEQAGDYHEISENVFVGRDVTIDDTARIKGAAIIGHNSTIGHAAFLRGDVLIGEKVNVGHATEVKHSIILSNAALAHLNYVGDSIVGSMCNISGGATLANWRFDRQMVNIKNGEERIPTNLEKMGSILGDGTFIGVSSVINPGTVLAKKSLVFPLLSVKGTYLTTATIK